MSAKSLQKLCKVGRIGGGTYGRVYEAQKPENRNSFYNIPEFNRETPAFAVKRNFVSPNLKESIGSIRELDILNLVKDHPFCIKLEDVSFEVPFIENVLSPANQNYVTDKVFFVLEKGNIDGEGFIHTKELVRQPWVNERKLLAVQTLLAVEFLHSRRIYHRDLKPANIICMLDSEGRLEKAKLTDFGLAQYYTDQAMSLPGFVTLWYRAPEILLMKNYDFKIDVWSLGCILFELFSANNRRFVQANSEESLINAIIDRVPFSKEDYILAQQLSPRKITKHYDFLQANLRNLREQMAYTESQIAQFNSSQLGGKPNSGTFDEFVDLLSHMLVSNPSKRWPVSQCLNHNFFKGYRELIDQIRTEFGINTDGEWVLKPDDTFLYFNNLVRTTGMKWFSIVYTNRALAPISNWYSHRIFFHALEMFDRFNTLVCPSDSTLESEIVVWIDTFLFISAKYFRILVPEFGLDMFAVGIIPEEFSIFRIRALQFEEYVIRDIFKFEIYRNTIYEIANDYLTETSILYLVKLFLRGEVPSGMSLKKVWTAYSDILIQANRTPSPASSPIAPVVSLLTSK